MSHRSLGVTVSTFLALPVFFSPPGEIDLKHKGRYLVRFYSLARQTILYNKRITNGSGKKRRAPQIKKRFWHAAVEPVKKCQLVYYLAILDVLRVLDTFSTEDGVSLLKRRILHNNRHDNACGVCLYMCPACDYGQRTNGNDKAEQKDAGSRKANDQSYVRWRQCCPLLN